MKYKLILLLSFCLGLVATQTHATQCRVVFPDGASVHDNSGKITINRKGKIKHSPDFILDTPVLDDRTANNEDSCDKQDCSASGQTVPKLQLPAFQYSNSQNNIVISSNQSLSSGSYGNVTVREKKKLKLTSTGVYKIKNLVLEKKAKLEIEDGVLWIETLVVKEKGEIKYKGHKDNFSTMYVQSLVAEKDSDIGKSHPEHMLIISYGHAVLKEKSEVEGFLYANNKVTMEKDAKVKGAVTAEIIEMKEDAEIHYEDKDLDDLTVCATDGNSQALPDPIAYWPVDICHVNGAAGEIVDVVGGYNGRTVDGADIDENAKFCQGLKFSGEDDHVNIPHQSAFELTEGAVSFWFKTDDVNFSNKAARGGQGLFSKDSSGTDNGSDHLTIWIDNNRKIFVRHQVGNTDNNIQGTTNINNNQWHHVVYSWGSNGMRLFVDGDLDDMRSATGDINSNPEPIILGANAWVTGNGQSDSGDLKDMFKGAMDEVQLYNRQLTEDNVQELFDKSAYNCDECEALEPVLVGHWKANLCALNGTNGEVIDAINGNNGFSKNGASIEDDGHFCQALAFDGEDAHVNIPHANEFELDDGTVSFWFKAHDLSNSSDPSHGGQGLFSKDSGGWNAGGEHLTIWLRSNGSIRVRHQLTNGNNSSDKSLEAPSGSISENQWYHLAYSWGEEGMQLFINGQLVDSNSDTRGIDSNPEPIILGANAWVSEDYSSNNNLKDKFDGEMDDLRLYLGQLNGSSVAELYQASNADTCVECNPEPVLTSRWPFDVCDIDQNNDVIVDVISGHNGVPMGDIDSDVSAVLCQGAEFKGNSAHVDVPHDEDFATEEGAVSLWFKVNDFSSYEYWNDEDDDDDDGHQNNQGQGHSNHGNGHGHGHQHDDDDDNDNNEQLQTLLSKSASGYGDGGDFALSVSSHGELIAHYETADDRLEIASSEGSLAANTWYHATFSWGDDGLKLYLNGQLVDANSNVTSGLENNIERLIMGANGNLSDEADDDHDDHDGHRHNNGQGHQDHGRGHGYGHHKDRGDDDEDDELNKFLNGSVDDVRFYSLQQPTDSEVAAIYAETDDSCDNCVTELPELVAHYTNDVCSIDGDGGDFVDIVNAYNGTFIDGVTQSVGKFCSAPQFGGNDEHINIPHQNDFASEQGAVAFWVYTPDIDYENAGGNTIHDGQALFSKDSQGTDNNAGHLTIWLRSDGDVRVRHQIGSQHELETSDGPVSESAWHHIAYSWGSAGKRLYVDGQLKVSLTAESGGLAGNAEPIILAANASITGDGVSEPSKLRNWFKGKLDDVRIYAVGQPTDEFIDDLYDTEYQCTACSNSLAHYKFEETEWTGAGSIIDSAGNFNGTNLGGVTPLLPPDPVSCQAMDVPYNNDDDEFDGMDTGINVKDDIGSTGTISMWFKADSDWNDGRGRTLFDASSASIYFYGVITTDGRLRFGFEDESDRDLRVTTGAFNNYQDRWVHVAFTWDLASKSAKIYVNGIEQSTSGTAANDLSGTLGNTYSLYIGDNRGAYHPSGSDNSANGQIDDVRIYSTAQSGADIQADAADVSVCQQRVHHYELSYDSPSSICSNPTLTVKACQDESCSTLVNGTQYVDIQYVVGNTYRVAVSDLQLDNGIGVYSSWGRLVIESGVFQVVGQNPVSENGYTCDPANCQISFDYTLELNFGGQDTEIPTQIAESVFSQAGQSQISVKKPDTCPLLEEPEPLRIAIECIDPAICSGEPFTIGGPNPITITPTDANGNLNYVVIDSSFDGDEVTLSDLSFGDVGRIRLHVDAGGAKDSTEFVVKPDYLGLADSISNTHTAGEQFTMAVTAYGANGGILPNFQSSQLGIGFERVAPVNVPGSNALLDISVASNNASTLSIPDSASIDSFNQFPAGESDPLFSGGTSELLYSSVNEVGQFAVDVYDADYMGTGPIYSNRYGSDPANMVIGRFIPAYFTSAVEFNFNAYCEDSFTYRGDLMQTTGNLLTLTAKNADNQTTTYYDADPANYFYYDKNSDFNSREYVGGDGTVSGAADNLLMATFDAGTTGDGSFAFTLSGDTLRFAQYATPLPPYMTQSGANQVDMLLAASALYDMDNVGIKEAYNDPAYLDLRTGPAIEGIEILDGRLTMGNIFGSDITQLTVSLQVQYYDINNDWIVNAVDNCTGYDSTHIRSLDSSYPITAEGAGTFTAGESETAGDDGDVVHVGLSQSSDKATEFDIEYTIPPELEFLMFDWDGDGQRDNSPRAKIIFGINRGNDRVIHWREVY